MVGKVERKPPADLAEARQEELYDKYLDAVLRGNAEDPDAFLARHGCTDETLRTLLQAVHREVASPRARKQADATAPIVAEEDAGDLPLKRLGEFRLLRQLGEGGMGVVYLARQDSLDRLVALKVIRPEFARSSTAMARFDREARAIAKLRHPNIVTVYAVGKAKGVRYIAMELATGQGLNTAIDVATAKGESIPIATVLRWVAELARALDYACEHGIVHRDIKPSNIRITPEGRPLLVDFGLARELDSAAVTLTEAFVGSPHYVAPEQIGRKGGAVDGRTDVYSLGIVLYQCLTGQVPFGQGTLEQVLQSILVEDPPPLRSIRKSLPGDVEVVTLKALEKDPDRRYCSAGAFADDLEALLEFRPIRARPPGPIARTMKWARRNPAAAAGAAATLVAVVALGGILGGQAYARAEARRAEALSALTLAKDKLGAYRSLRETGAQVEAEVVRLRNLMEREYLQPEQYEILDQHEATLQTARLERERLFYEIQQALQRAERLDPDVEGTQEMLVELYMEKWRQANAVHQAERTMVDAVDVAEARATEAFYHSLVEEADGSKRHVAELRGGSWLRIFTDPPGAEVYLFEFREQSELFEGGEPRLVPVPTSSSSSRPPPVRPGTWCLRVVRPAGELRVNDLVVELAGYPIEGTILVQQGNDVVNPLDRLVEVDGVPVRDAYAVRHLCAPAQLGTGGEVNEKEFVFERSGEQYMVSGASLASLGIVAVEPRVIAERGRVSARVYQSGEVRSVSLPEGLRVRNTAAPLLASPSCRVGVTPLHLHGLARGTYVALLRRDGYEDQRVYIPTEHGSFVALNLLKVGSVPEGFVSVAYGQPGRHPLFLIMDREVTCREYLEFLNDPETLRQIDESDQPIRYSRHHSEGANWPRAQDGRFTLPADWDDDWPVLGISWADAMAYARWRTNNAREKGLPWRFSLPTMSDWGHAGLGAGFYVFGNRFRPRWVSSCFARPKPYPEPVLSFPIDESVFGVFDMSGSAIEWLDDWFWQEQGQRPLMGGSWGDAQPDRFRVNYWRGASEESVAGTYGFRLVLHTEQTQASARQEDQSNAAAQFHASRQYLSEEDSPYDFQAGTGVFLESFEDGRLNTPGVTALAGSVKAPGPTTNSVDGDDGVIDGSGRDGWSFSSADGAAGITFVFDEKILGGLPTWAGIVWTEGSGRVALEAFDAEGVSLGTINYAELYGSREGGTADDHYLGVSFWGGIFAIRISNPQGGVEVDHLQFGWICDPRATAVELASSSCPACLGPIPYLCKEDSPFDLSGLTEAFFLEDFEDGLLNTPGVTAAHGSPWAPGSADSVDCDDGVIDGAGADGWSFWASSAVENVTFSFDRAILGGLPTEAGIVWTEGGGMTVTFEAFDADGLSLGTISGLHAGCLPDGTTGEDHFYGVRHAGGISAIRIGSSWGGIEIDHLQYGRIRGLSGNGEPPE